MTKYVIIDSNANRTVLSYLGWDYEEGAGVLVFTPPEKPFKVLLSEVASALIELGYAREVEALSIARTFFMNEAR